MVKYNGLYQACAHQISHIDEYSPANKSEEAIHHYHFSSKLPMSGTLVNPKYRISKTVQLTQPTSLYLKLDTTQDSFRVRVSLAPLSTTSHLRFFPPKRAVADVQQNIPILRFVPITVLFLLVPHR
jgi:hypothetical protein